jgi:MFS family permease
MNPPPAERSQETLVAGGTSPASTPARETTAEARPLEYAADDRRGRWTVGTLTYSTAGIVVLFAWLLCGDFAWQMKERAIVPVAQLAMRALHASDFLVGLIVVSLPSALSTALGPVVATWSDRHRGRWGRRIPYLLIPAPIVVVSIGALAFSPQMGQALHDALGPARSPGVVRCSLFVFGVFWTLAEVAAITAEYLFYALINDVVPKLLVGRFFGLFRAVSLLAGIIFNLRVIGYAETHTGLVFLGMAVLYGIGFTLMCVMVKEGEYPPPDEPLDRWRERGGVFAAIEAYVRESFARPHYLWIYAAVMLGLISFGPVNSFSVFYAKSIGLGVVGYGEYLALTYFISMILAYPLGALADRLHPLRVGIAVMAIYAAVTLWGGIFATTPTTFAIAFVGHGVASGAFYTVHVPIFQRLFPRAKFGLHFSAANLVRGLGFVIVPAVVGRLLDKTGHVYRYTFTASGLVAVAAFVVLLLFHRRFMLMGGPKGYVAPE